MKTLPLLMLPCLLATPGRAQGAPAAPKRVTLSIREADLKDVLRAAAEDTDCNLTFDPSIETRIRGLDLKGMTFQEILDEVLPTLGLGYVKVGRTFHIQKSDGTLRFYPVDYLSLRRTGKKEFQVNASGQLIQVTGQGGGGAAGGSSGQSGANSAYTSSLETGNSSDPWQELQAGLGALIFGAGASDRPTSGKVEGGPASVAMHAGGRSLIIHPDSGLVVVGADPGTHTRVKAYLDEMRRRQGRQVLLEAKIVEVNLGNDSSIGVDWNAVLTPGAVSGGSGTDIAASLASGETVNTNLASASAGLAKFVIQNARVSATLSALARSNRLQVLSSPRLATLNNQKAILRVVREEAFFLQQSQTTGSGGVGGFSTTVNIMPLVVPVGLILDIQPQIGDDGGITLAVNPSVSEIVTTRSLIVKADPVTGAGGAQATLPVVDRRDLDTVVKMRSGETLVLAGILRTTEGADDRGVPWLRRIPLLGDLLSKKEKTRTHTELAIFITPTLVEDGAQVDKLRSETQQRLEKAGANLDPKPGAVTSVKTP